MNSAGEALSVPPVAQERPCVVKQGKCAVFSTDRCGICLNSLVFLQKDFLGYLFNTNRNFHVINFFNFSFVHETQQHLDCISKMENSILFPSIHSSRNMINIAKINDI